MHCLQSIKAQGQQRRRLMPYTKLECSNRKNKKTVVIPKAQMLAQKDHERFKNASKIITVDERLDALVKQEEQTRLRNEETENLKRFFRQIDQERAEAAKAMVSQQEEDLYGDSDKQQTMEKAFIEKQEQEEEVRKLNRYILNAKCQAVRDMQIKEKHDIEKKQTDDRIRLEKMVIDTNKKALAAEDHYALQRKAREAQYAEEIRQQLLQRETIRLMEAERAEREGMIAREANMELVREEERLAQEARKRRDHFRAELDQVVEMSNLFKKMLCEQEQEADVRNAKYMNEKRAKEEQLKLEKRLARENFERKQALLFEIAKKLMTSKSNREELTLMRERERAERDFRRQEKEAAMRRKKLEDDIREARQRQMEELKTRQALQIAREEKSFKEMIARLQFDEEQAQKRECENRKKRETYRSEITKQMKDKAEYHRRLLENTRNEANIFREAERKRIANVKAVIGAKLTAMRDACLPEQYIKDIERSLDRILKSNIQK